jgi:hypothetical protein
MERSHLEDVALGDSLSALQHLLQNPGLLLHLGHLFRRLCSVVGFVPVVEARHDLHQTVCLLEVGGSASPDQLLELG